MWIALFFWQTKRGKEDVILPRSTLIAATRMALEWHPDSRATVDWRNPVPSTGPAKP